MPEYFYLVDFQCPKCNHWDEEVRVPKKDYDEAITEGDGLVSHTCSKCGCDFRQYE